MSEPQFIEKFYVMDPETDDLVPNGRHLVNGMVVLAEATDKRSDLGDITIPWKYDRALKNNRWCTVSYLETNEYYIHFVGIYEDGTKRAHRVDIDDAWYVKRDSIEKTDERYDKIFGAVMTAMKSVCEQIFAPDANYMDELAYKATDAILKEL